MNLLGQLGLLLVSTWVLVKATELVINNLDQFSKHAKFAKFGLAAVVVAASTSFPEFFVGITSAIDGIPNLSLGNVIGSNIANISLIVGLAAVISGSIAIRGEYMKRDLAYAFLVGAIPLVLLSDGRMNRLEGLGLLIGYFIYVQHFFRGSHPEPLKVKNVITSGRFWRGAGIRKTSRKTLMHLLFALGVVLIAAEMVVRSGTAIALELRLPVLLVGLFVVAVGTSLPELSLWIREAVRHEGGLVFGNILGSIMTNSMLVVGATALIRPIQVQAVESYLLASIAYVAIFWVFWFATRSKRRLERREGFILIGLYFAFILAEFAKENGYSRLLMQLYDFLVAQAQLLV